MHDSKLAWILGARRHMLNGRCGVTYSPFPYMLAPRCATNQNELLLFIFKTNVTDLADVRPTKNRCQGRNGLCETIYNPSTRN